MNFPLSFRIKVIDKVVALVHKKSGAPKNWGTAL